MNALRVLLYERRLTTTLVSRLDVLKVSVMHFAEIPSGSHTMTQSLSSVVVRLDHLYMSALGDKYVSSKLRLNVIYKRKEI